MKLNWLERTLVTAPMCFTLCTSEKLFAKAMKKLGIKKAERPDFVANWHSNATVHYFENKEALGVTFVVCLRGYEGVDPVVVNGLIVHEAVHIWQQVRKYLGEKKPSAEFEAYSIQNISMQLMAEFERQAK